MAKKNEKIKVALLVSSHAGAAGTVIEVDADTAAVLVESGIADAHPAAVAALKG